MPGKIQIPETQSFRLEMLDKRQGVPTEEATKVKIRQATVRQNSARSRLFSEYIREISKDNEQRERVVVRLPLYDLVTEEVYLTLVGCNLTTADGSAPLFRFATHPLKGEYLDMTRHEFDEAWGLLDDMTANEIHSKVLIVNPHWGMGITSDDSGTPVIEDAHLGE